MVRDNDFNWQFGMNCYCALDRDLHHLIELRPTTKEGQFALLMVLNFTNLSNNRLTKERAYRKVYLLETHKLDLRKDWKIWVDKFHEEYLGM